MYTETRWLKPLGGLLVYHGAAAVATTSVSLFSSSFESPQHICGYFVDLFCWKKFLGGVWKQKGMWISFSSVRNMRRACGRSVWQLPTSAPGRASSSCFPPTPAFHRCRTQRCSEPSDRPTHRSLHFFLVIFIFDTWMFHNCHHPHGDCDTVIIFGRYVDTPPSLVSRFQNGSSPSAAKCSKLV